MTEHDLLVEAANRTPGNETRMSIRDLIDLWGAKRRGYWVVEMIRRDLAAAGLTTEPSFAEGWIDNVVTLVPLARVQHEEVQDEASVDLVDATDRSLPEVSLRVGSLPSANLGVISVVPDDPLEKAQSLMMANDYSQLAVMSGPRTFRGAITWESIAQARIRDPEALLREAVTPGELVRSEDDLLAQIPKIVDAGFVFVLGPDNRVQGIVTTADLSLQFATLAKPFFLLAEIERRLRRVIDNAFSAQELASAIDPADLDRTVKSAHDLSLGEYVRLMEAPSNWTRFGWALDRKVFVESLQNVRQIRNDVMHFSPDPLDDLQVRRLETFLKWLRKLDPTP